MEGEIDYDMLAARRIGGGAYWPKHFKRLFDAAREGNLDYKRLKPILQRFEEDFIRLATTGTPETADRTRKGIGAAKNKRLNEARGAKLSARVDKALLAQGLDTRAKKLGVAASKSLVSVRRKALKKAHCRSIVNFERVT
jgi:hypothetical protein